MGIKVAVVIGYGALLGKFTPYVGVQWNHAALVDSSLNVIEAIPGGVKATPWAEFVGRYNECYLIHCVALSEEQSQAVIGFAQGNIGKKYDWPGCIKAILRGALKRPIRHQMPRNAHTCASLVWASFNHIGIDLTPMRQPDVVLLPDDIANSRVLKQLYACS